MTDERDYSIPRGPRFEQGPDGVLFSFVMDPGSIVGPRAATEADKVEHAEAWAAFCPPDAPEAAPAPKAKRARRAKAP